MNYDAFSRDRGVSEMEKNIVCTTSGMTLFTDPDSVAGLTLRILIAEKECPCEVQVIRGDVPHALQHVNPSGAMPFLVDKMLALFDFNSIVMYLQERFPADQLLPGHPKLRAQIRQVCSWLQDRGAKYDEARDTGSLPWLEDALSELNAICDGPQQWLLGNEYTLADVYATALLHRICTDRNGEKDDSPLCRYARKLFDRAGFKETQRQSTDRAWRLEVE